MANVVDACYVLLKLEMPSQGCLRAVAGYELCQCKAVLVVMPYALWKECCSCSPAFCACCNKHAQSVGACCYVGR
jgi:hypothetical protein